LFNDVDEETKQIAIRRKSKAEKYLQGKSILGDQASIDNESSKLNDSHAQSCKVPWIRRCDWSQDFEYEDG
jgi:hypothetical protein